MRDISPRILPAYKPPGITSFSMIRSFKKIYGNECRKVGHFGSLDPFAEGLLLIGFNGAMKFNNFLQETFSKTYVATGIFGRFSPTGDGSDTESISKVHCPPLIKKLGQEELEQFCRSHFLGSYNQAPHHYSAAKHKGRPLYQYAREGIMIDKPPVKRFIYDIHVLRWNYPELIFQIIVSSGTYIRGLFEDICKKLDTKGILSHLKRTAIGPCRLDEAVSKETWNRETLKAHCLSPKALFQLET